MHRRDEMKLPGMGVIVLTSLIHAAMLIVIAWLVTEAAIRIAEIIWS